MGMTCADKAFELLNKLDFEDGKFEITDALIEMAEWEKQQLIDGAVEWIKDQLCYYVYIETNSDTFEKEIEFDEFKMANDFKQAMKGE